MVELREQLGALLRLEVTYATTDYLGNLTVPRKCCESSKSQNGGCDEISLVKIVQDQASSSPDEGGKIVNDESIQSSATPTCDSNTAITEQRVVSWREKICEWAYQVADHFDLTRDLVYIALHYIDRICDASDTTALLRDKDRFQLLAMASLCLAIKLHGGLDTHDPSVESSIVETILYLGRGHFSAEQLKVMEVKALEHLQWRLNPPTPQTFIAYLLELFPVEEKSKISEIALYTIELSVHDYYFIPYKPSVLALAALSHAAQMLGYSGNWMTAMTEDLLKREGYDEDIYISSCMNRLNCLFANTGTKLEDFADVPSLENMNHFNEICRERSPTSVIH